MPLIPKTSRFHSLKEMFTFNDKTKGAPAPFFFSRHKGYLQDKSKVLLSFYVRFISKSKYNNNEI
ncbi:hypothetical protein THF1C08_10551 [Vibrio jasicida]|uniref:Uncharacterized protein n=1 Tax=Vibrio jasicida TaxID=766224 RepID=A0AAU9QFR2_9VIBR|nr:hypothetical protein THF1C08_10551 [Vibrio jasicida]CAH1567078.1 hypothetical protein THF1A12_10553 [Vibrio jasicida]